MSIKMFIKYNFITRYKKIIVMENSILDAMNKYCNESVQLKKYYKSNVNINNILDK